MKQVLTKFVKWFLPALFVVYYTIITLFVHIHIESGTIIIHSHLFNKSADGTSHEHASLAEIQLYHILSLITATDGAVNLLQLHFFALSFCKIDESVICPDYLSSADGCLSLRAPPAKEIRYKS